MNTTSESTASAVRILREIPVMRRTEPTRSLFDPSSKRLKYVPREHTDVARTFRKHRLLARIQGAGV